MRSKNPIPGFSEEDLMNSDMKLFRLVIRFYCS